MRAPLGGAIDVEFQGTVCFIQFNRPESNNTINARLVSECHAVLAQCEEQVSIVVLRGSPAVFCDGADFKGLADELAAGGTPDSEPESLYDLWLRLATGPFVTIAHVSGRANAGGIGFVAASDIVLAEEGARFGLSELLFGLYPACVLPFLVRRVGFQRAHYLTLTTQPITARQACEWGLVDAIDEQGHVLLRRHLQRLRRLSKAAIRRYKAYMQSLNRHLVDSRTLAVQGSREVFRDARNLQAISHYVATGVFPWEAA